MKAHIVPDWITKGLEDDSGRIRAFTGPERGTIRQTGEWDRHILCSRCDGFLGKHDAFAKRFFTELHNEVKRLDESSDEAPSRLITVEAGEESFFTISELKRFLLSVAWRASISERPACESMSLGPLEGVVRDIVFASDTIDPSVFPFFLEWLDDVDDLPKQLVRLPASDRMTNGYRCFHFMICGVDIHFVTDSRARFEPEYQVASSHERLVLWRRQFGERGEINAIAKLIRSHNL